jgi:group I intron endonuclease
MEHRKSINGIVYKATSPSGKVYIGITITTLKERIRIHVRSVNKGSRIIFHEALRKYKPENINWEIIDSANTWAELCELEKKYIKLHDSFNKGYNLTLGGEGTFGLKYDEEWCIKNSKIRKEFFQNPQNRKMQSLANIKSHQENPNQAIAHSSFMIKRYKNETEREKTAEGTRKFLADPINRKRHSIQRGARPFLVYKNCKFIGEWLTQRECARDLNLDFGHINSCLHGKRVSHCGYIFKYKE